MPESLRILAGDCTVTYEDADENSTGTGKYATDLQARQLPRTASRPPVSGAAGLSRPVCTNKTVITRAGEGTSMSSDEQDRDDRGQFGPKMTEQDILKAFDYAEDPMVTTTEVRDLLDEEFGIAVTGEAVRNRLQQLEAEGLVRSKQFGARAVGWQGQVAPRLSGGTAERSEERRETPRGEFVSLDGS
jgi:hypothetical protein